MKSIRLRIIVLFTFALIFLGLAIFKEYSNVQGSLSNAKESLNTTKKITYLSEIIHSIQQERGLSAANLAKQDETLHKKLIRQREISDSRLSKISEYISTEDKKAFAVFVKELRQMRKKIDARSVIWNDIKHFYTQKIEKVLNQIHISSGNLDHAKETTHKLDAICNLAYARENLGLLRATLSRYYQKGKLDIGESLDVAQRYFGFESRYRSFLLEQNNLDIQEYKNRIESDVFFSVNEQVRSLLEKNFKNMYGNTLQWWSESTLVIDTMLEVEKRLLEQIQKYSQEQISKYEKELLIYTLSAITAFIIISILTYLTVIRILQALSILMRSLQEVEQTENFEIRINELENDEFGKLSFSINQLLSYTDKIIKEKEELASIDTLTGIMNRRSFMLSINKEVARSRRYGTPISLIFCDIDKFKSVNDKYGHKIGDEVLVAFSDTIGSHIRETDLFARWGGEEFVILTVETNKENAAKLADNLRKLVMDIDVSPVENITCSFGVAELDDGETFDQLCERADMAVYEAKNTGRNKVCIN